MYVHFYKYGFVQDGLAGLSNKDDIHHIDEEINTRESWTIHVGLDFGLTPAAVFVI